MATATEGNRLVSRGYGKIVLLTLVAIGVGCGLMAFEIWGEFGSMKATSPKIEKVKPLEPKAGAAAPVPPPGPPRPGPGPGPIGPGPVGPGPVVPPGGM